MPEDEETAIVITVPETDVQVLVRLPGHIDRENVAVDFRSGPFGMSWTPSVFFDHSVEVRHQ
jgi:hypothetical protein